MIYFILIYLIIILFSLIIIIELNDGLDLSKSIQGIKKEWFYAVIPGINILLIILWLYWKIKIR